jgi:hypothetical protein
MSSVRRYLAWLTTLALLCSSAAKAEDAGSSYPHLNFGMDLGVVLWNDFDRDIVRPGAAFDARIGWDTKYVEPMLELGFRVNGVEVSEIPRGSPQAERERLKNVFVGLGARFKVPNRSVVTPFLDGVFDLNWWTFAETRLVCNYWYCTAVDEFRFAPGFHGRLGLMFRVSPQAYIEAGCGLGMSFAGDFFGESQSWLEPFAGFTYSFPAGYENRTSMY